MALAGGVTTAVTCPGDANLIGGTCAAIKTSGKTVSEMTMVPELAFHMCLTDDVRTTYSSKRAPCENYPNRGFYHVLFVM